MPAHTYTKSAQQSTNSRTAARQIQDQGLYIRDSHNILVSQIEVEGLLVLQLALEAALEAVLIFIDAQNDDDVRKLQTVIQQINVIQAERQRVVIQCSDNVTISQAEIEVTAVVQAAVELLATITAKFLAI